MRMGTTSRIMRTTIDIDAPILKDLKRIQMREGKPLGRVVSDLLAQALAAVRTTEKAPPTFAWHSRPMQARVDLSDKHAVLDAMDEPGR
jgi:hypothetical protein